VTAATRREFVAEALLGKESIAALCRRYGVSRASAHAWIRRFRERGADGLDDRSRRPHTSPTATPRDVIDAVLAARDAAPTHGPLRLRETLAMSLAERTPSARTIARILARENRIAFREAA
jgi:transposase-like protein